MKNRPIPSLNLSSLVSATTIVLAASVSASVWQWDGGAGTGNWQSATNWNPDNIANFGGTHADRLNVNGAQKLVYTSAEGTTNYTGDTVTGGGRGLTIGNLSSGTMEISGGTFSSLGSPAGDVIGNGNTTAGILTINGGNFIGTNAGTNLGIGTGPGRVSTLNISSGKATLAILNMNSSDADVNLSGTGELEVNSISMTALSTGNINFNGGILRARTTTTTFLQGLTGATINGGGVTVDSNGSNITIGQALLAGTGSGGLTKTGSGTLTLSGANTYTGATTLTAGTLSVATAANLGAAASNLVFDGGTLQITGGSLTSFSGIGHGVSFNTGKTVGLNISSSTTTFTADQVLNQGTGGLTKLGAGKLILDQNNTYSGLTTISAGALIKTAADSTSGDISVANGSSLVLRGGITDGAGQTLTLDGGGINTAGYFFAGSAVLRGALQAQTGSNTWQGDIVVSTANTRIGVQSGASLTLTGAISGTSPLFRAGLAGEDIVLNGTASWTGTTTLFSGGGAIRIAGNNKLSTLAAGSFTSGGTTVLDLNGFNQEFAGFSSDGSLTSATITNTAASTTSTLTSNTPTATSFTFRGGITDGAGKVAFTKTGQGTQVLLDTNSYTGATIVSGGKLTVNGNIGAGSAVTVSSGATLGGVGTVGGATTIQAGGYLAVGNGVGTQTFGNTLDFEAGSIFEWDIVSSADADGLAADGTGGSDFDTANMSMAGAVNVDSGAIFRVVLGGSALTQIQDTNNAFWNTPGGTQTWNMSAIFGQPINTGGFTLVDTNIDVSSYGSFTVDGNALTWTAVPEASSSLLALLGATGLLLRRHRKAEEES